MPAIHGIHHLKFAVSDLDRSAAFYAKALGARRIEALDHRHPGGGIYAYILEVPDLGTMLELRLNPAAAAAMRGFDPVTLSVAAAADIESWVTHLNEHGIANSGMMIGYIGWLVAFEDPDGIRVRLYTKETHGPEIAPAGDPAWL